MPSKPVLGGIFDFLAGGGIKRTPQQVAAETDLETVHARAFEADERQAEQHHEMLAEQQRTRDIARTLQLEPVSDPEEDRFRQIMQRSARDRDREVRTGAIATPAARDTAGGSKNRTMPGAIKGLFRGACKALTRRLAGAPAPVRRRRRGEAGRRLRRSEGDRAARGPPACPGFRGGAIPRRYPGMAQLLAGRSRQRQRAMRHVRRKPKRPFVAALVLLDGWYGGQQQHRPGAHPHSLHRQARRPETQIHALAGNRRRRVPTRMASCTCSSIACRSAGSPATSIWRRSARRRLRRSPAAAARRRPTTRNEPDWRVIAGGTDRAHSARAVPGSPSRAGRTRVAGPRGRQTRPGHETAEYRYIASGGMQPLALLAVAHARIRGAGRIVAGGEARIAPVAAAPAHPLGGFCVVRRKRKRGARHAEESFRTVPAMDGAELIDILKHDGASWMP